MVHPGGTKRSPREYQKQVWKQGKRAVMAQNCIIFIQYWKKKFSESEETSLGTTPIRTLIFMHVVIHVLRKVGVDHMGDWGKNNKDDNWTQTATAKTLNVVSQPKVLVPRSQCSTSVARLVNFVVNLHYGQVKFFEEFILQKNCEIHLLIKTFLGLVEMMFGLVNVTPWGGIDP